MIDMEKLARDGFKIIDGLLHDSHRSLVTGVIRVREFGWGNPCTEYHFDDYALNNYSIVKAVHYDEWYLMKNGYQEICKLRYLGGKNWETW